MIGYLLCIKFRPSLLKYIKYINYIYSFINYNAIRYHSDNKRMSLGGRLWMVYESTRGIEHSIA